MKRWMTALCALMLAACTAQTPAETKNTKPELEILGVTETNRSFDAANAKVDPGSTALIREASVSPAKKKNYTVMVYMIGSNLESRFGAATADLQEMDASGLSFKDTNLLVYAGGSRRWNTNISNRHNSVLDMSRDPDDRIVAVTDEKGDMASAQSLSEYLNFCVKNYPADHYALIFWDHGGGPLWGYGADELFKNDTLILEEIRSGMADTAFSTGIKLDWIGFDACLMGSLESAALWQDYASYMVASEELEAGDGWDYSFLKVLNDTSDPRKIVSSIVASYADYYEANKSEYSDPDATLAAYDLGALDGVIAALDGYTDALSSRLQGGYADISKSIASAKGFGLAAVSSASEGYDLIDLYDWIALGKDSAPEEAKALREALDSFIVANRSNVGHAGGVSVYFPRDNKDLFLSGRSTYEGVCVSENYSSFMNAYAEYWLNPEMNAWDLSDVRRDDTEITLTFTDAEMEEIQNVYYTVLEHYENYGYKMTLCNIRLKPDETNTVHIPLDPELIVSDTRFGRGNEPWMFVETENSENTVSYRSLSAYLSNNYGFHDLDFDYDEPVTVLLHKEKETGKLSVQSIKSNTDVNGSAGKNDLDMSRYYAIYNWFGSTRVPARNADGTMKPFFEWNTAGLYGGEYYSLDSGFGFVTRPVSELSGDYSIQITVRDIYGNVHGSEVLALPAHQPDLIRVPTDAGMLYFTDIEGERILYGYEGEDTAVTVPASAGGKPVTRIGSGAFSGNKTVVSLTLEEGIETLEDSACSGMSALEDVHLPSSLQYIGNRAFYSCGQLTALEVPDGVKQIGRSAFSYTSIAGIFRLPASIEAFASTAFANSEDVEAYALDEANPAYTVKDGVLFTKDGRTLVSWPAGSPAESYTVPDGVEVLDFGSFNECTLKHIVFPETLKKIDNCAFFDAAALEELALPDSLESIGTLAFGAIFRGWGEQPVIDTVRIGKNVSWIGAEAFCNLDILSFDVDPENEHYASSGVFVTTKAKDTVLFVPLADRQFYEIPDGITTLSEHCFEKCEDETEFILPDSLFRIPVKVFPYGFDNDSNRVYKTVFHCSEGSAAEAYARTYEIPYDGITDPAKLTYEDVTEETPNGTCTYRVFSDRAVLTGYDGRDEYLDLPEKVNEVPLTGIRVTDYASYSVKKLHIPAGVHDLSGDSLSGFSSLEKLVLDGDAYIFEDNVLYTGDGKKLVCGLRNAMNVIVRDGTEEIMDKAFYSHDRIMAVRFPSSLKTIGADAFRYSSLMSAEWSEGLAEIREYAFYDTELTEVRLPSSVKIIGNSAFGDLKHYTGLRLPAELETLGKYAFESNSSDGAYYGTGSDTMFIPARASVDPSSFNWLDFTKFEVSEENELYTADGPLLLSKDGKTVIRCAPGVSGEVVIPDGVETLGVNSFTTVEKITDLYIPDSVLALSSAFYKRYNTEFTFTVHAHKGTEAEYFAVSKGIAFEEVKD